MEYSLELLSDDDFERLVNQLCQKLLGTGTVSFTKGRDGGRDGRFEGTANKYPSEKESWTGKFIIQAKHTTNLMASCSDNDFFDNKSSIIKKEIDKIKKLKENNEIDYYLLFTNRNESAKRENVKQFIIEQTNIINADVIGNQTIESWLKQHKDIVRLFGLDKYSAPFDFYADDIKEVILFFSANINIKNAFPKDDIINISKEEKNRLNNLCQIYYDNTIRKQSLKYFKQIDDFLENPINENYAFIYDNFAAELNNKILIQRSDFESFEQILGYIYDKIFDSHKTALSKHGRLIWIVLHHLYFNCHIGRTE